jgi:acyl dehydratase
MGSSMMGKYLEEFLPGARFETGTRTLTANDVASFAALTGDFSRIHTSEEHAKSTRYGRQIVHGALVFSASIGLTTQTRLLDDTLIALSRVDGLRFVRPVFIGDTIRVVKRVVTVEPAAADFGVLGFETRVLNQRNEIVIAYCDRCAVKRQVTAPADANPAPALV